MKTVDTSGVLDKVILGLERQLEDTEAVDIVTFAEGAKYLNQRLYPRQRLFLKLYYKLDLTSYPCWCRVVGKTDPDAICGLCFDTGVYDEFEDVKRLLRADNPYARMWMPGLCRHHLTSECEVKYCHGDGVLDLKTLKRLAADYRRLDDDELRRRLKSHWAQTLLLVCGRRGSKSLLGAVINRYCLYLLLRDPDPHKSWGIVNVPIGTRNVRTDETQAKILLEQMKGLLKESPWFQKVDYTPFEVSVDFGRRNIFARSYHSNSSSVRGQTLIRVFRDEFWHFNKTSGKLSDRAMAQALFPSILSFDTQGKIVLTTTPLNRTGVCWEYMDGAQKRLLNALVVQMATWEMNPTIAKSSKLIEDEYTRDPEGAEIEYGAQVADTQGVFLPADAVDRCVVRDMRPAPAGERGVKYSLHIDLSRKFDRTGLCITHYDRKRKRVVVDRLEAYEPSDYSDWDAAKWGNELGEIDHDKVFNYVCRLWDLGFRFQSITFDQFNSQGLLQRFRKQFNDPEGNWIQQLTISQRLNNEMFGNLRTIVTQGTLEMYPHSDAVRELKLLSKVVKPSGAFKVEAPPREHDDLADRLAASALMTLVLRLNISSSITVVHAPAAGRGGPQPVEGRKHNPDCSEQGCSWGCRRAWVRERQLLGVRHLKGCDVSSCVMMCPVRGRKMEN